MEILIATANLFKIEGISNAFRKIFPKENINITYHHVKSGVQRQPTNKAILIGAENRIKYARREYSKGQYDYIVSCESGLSLIFEDYFNVHLVLIQNRQKKMAKGVSSGLAVPYSKVPNILNSSINVMMRKYFKNEEGVKKLSNNTSSRAKQIEEATLMALSYFNWPEE